MATHASSCSLKKCEDVQGTTDHVQYTTNVDLLLKNALCAAETAYDKGNATMCWVQNRKRHNKSSGNQIFSMANGER
eukprot:6195471-Pleurochrysis_carterae.AAC.1